jgi:hypothetical protein
MKPPLCSYETHYTSYRSAWGVLHEEAVATIRPCRCLSHDYVDFDEQLGRLHPGLHLGFDLRKRRWVIYKWVNELDRAPLGNGEFIVAVSKIMDIVFTCEVAQEYRGKEGGWRHRTLARPFGDWVLIQIAKSATDRFVRGSGWVERTLKEIGDKNQAAADKRTRKNADAWVNDCMSSADRGNPFFRRLQFRQKKVRANHPIKGVA